jgi:ATP phosphoribosyltransferase
VRLDTGSRSIVRPAGKQGADVEPFVWAGENGRLTLAVPSKGRMMQPALDLCTAAGLAFEATERSLVVPCSNAPVDLLLVRPHDIPEYVQDGVVNTGITGANLVVESEADVVTVAELGFARCTLEAAVPQDAPQQTIADLSGLRVATAYPTSTRARLAALGVSVELVPVSGSVEAAPRLGLADAIVDLVSTGSTASANGLRRIGSLLSSQAVLLTNRAAQRDRSELVERLELMLSAVVAARRRRYLMMNAPASALDEIRSILPGMGAPSVLELADEGQIAVHAAVDVDQVWELLAPLKAAGASSILVLPVERLVP